MIGFENENPVDPEQPVSATGDSSVPACPQCRRRIAAWRLDHCIYCGAVFPPDFRAGFTEPEALKFVDRPALPPGAARQLEMLKVLPTEGKTRIGGRVLVLISLPVFGVLFYLLYRIVARYLPSLAVLVLVAGAGFLGYLTWSAFKRRG